MLPGTDAPSWAGHSWLWEHILRAPSPGTALAAPPAPPPLGGKLRAEQSTAACEVEQDADTREESSHCPKGCSEAQDQQVMPARAMALV